MGTVFERQGRLGAALASRKEALDTYKDLGERGYWLAEMLSGYASALIQVGRGEEATPLLDEALRIARSLKNEVLVAQALIYRGDQAFYSGNVSAARTQFEQALASAAITEDPHVVLIARLRLARTAIAEGRGPSALSILEDVEQKAHALGLPYLAAESKLHRGKALHQARKSDAARAALEQAVAQSEELGLRLVQAQSHYALGQLFKATKDEARSNDHASKASNLLQEIQKEAQPADVLKRADLREIAGR
jgi:tetratricopeptide (TPR) repeat protein